MGEVPSMYNTIIRYRDHLCIRATIFQASLFEQNLTRKGLMGNIDDSFQMLEVIVAVLWSGSEAANTVIRDSKFRKILYKCEDFVIGTGIDGKGYKIYGFWMSIACEMYSIVRCTK
jgi:hypothetical protein